MQPAKPVGIRPKPTARSILAERLRARGEMRQLGRGGAGYGDVSQASMLKEQENEIRRWEEYRRMSCPGAAGERRASEEIRVRAGAGPAAEAGASADSDAARVQKQGPSTAMMAISKRALPAASGSIPRESKRPRASTPSPPLTDPRPTRRMVTYEGPQQWEQIRVDVESVPRDAVSPSYKSANAVFPPSTSRVPPDEYFLHADQQRVRLTLNELSWRIAFLNTDLEGRPCALQRAVDAWIKTEGRARGVRWSRKGKMGERWPEEIDCPFAFQPDVAGALETAEMRCEVRGPAGGYKRAVAHVVEKAKARMAR
ncbi:hypothetical protein BDK51DRAFT_40161 [Blyttiomyces helicus]|uniref:DUF8032 domain-containing protein n=1 Tax=Blyttiomyces helicus TaxID=388810 RepID=A0A4P9VVW8_9FUNG|nr:hypothetical protein BDK51DRAFT_40161 [Blyttiomyces helicus]|eukprot:RKO83282.1 hypothetical protein BDK51DRAFT_40161 [Blyttiomyces helicus]